MRYTHYSIIAIVVAVSLPAHADSLDAVMKQARADGLPADVLENKVREGLAKHVPQARIEQVVRQMAQVLATTRTWMQRAIKHGNKKAPALPKELWIAAATAQMAGIKRDLIEPIVRETKQLTTANQRIDALVDLHMRGFEAKRCRALVQRLRKADLAQLGRTADQIRRTTGLTRAEVADALTRTLREHNSLQSARQQMLGSGRSHTTEGPGSAGPGYGPGPAASPGAGTGARGAQRGRGR